MESNCDAVLIGICCYQGAVSLRGSRAVGAVGELEYEAERWKTREDGLWHSSSAVQTGLSPVSLPEE